MSETDKACIQCTGAVTQKEVGGTRLLFSKRRSQGFLSENFRMISLLGEHFFFKSLGTTELFRIFRASAYIHVQNNFSYAPSSDIREAL